jgi:hypothetical protein
MISPRRFGSLLMRELFGKPKSLASRACVYALLLAYLSASALDVEIPQKIAYKNAAFCDNFISTWFIVANCIKGNYAFLFSVPD